MTAPSPMGREAENYARTGWAVFPVKPRDKTPLTPKGVKDATTRLEQIRAWWQKWPEANIGLACGQSGIVVIDLDQRGKHDGVAEWEALLRQHHLTLHTSTSLTGGGGRHLLFRAPPGVTIKNSAGKLAPGIDVRGEGGYIVLPPSIHPSGKPYCWADDHAAIAPLPAPVVELLMAEPDPWQIYTLKDALLPRPPLEWMVRGLLPVGSLSIWYGAPGTFKSLILADLCTCVVAGRNWLAGPDGKGGYATKQGAALWLDFDNGPRRTHERFAALARAYQVPDHAPLYYASMPEPALDAGDTQSMGDLANRIVRLDAALVVIDNLGVISGEADENSAEMQRPMAGLRWLAEATGAAVVALHHQRKANGVAARSGESLRGHGSIEAKIDLGLMVARDGRNITLSATKVRGKEVSPFGATFSFENDAHDELVTARFWPFDPADEENEAMVELETNIVAYLARHPHMTGSQVYQAVGGNKQKVFDAIRALKRIGKLGEKKGPGISQLLYVID